MLLSFLVIALCSTVALAQQKKSRTATKQVTNNTAKDVLATDMTVFGLKLGEKFTVPECERIGNFYNNNKSTCYKRDSIYSNNKKILPTEPIITDEVEIDFPLSEAPTMASYGTIVATIINGTLEGISFNTRGISDNEDVLVTLKEKYGKPTVLIPTKTQNRLGATFDFYIASWKFDNLDVSFFGVLTTLDKGSVQIDTKIGGKWRDKKLSEMSKDKRPL